MPRYRRPHRIKRKFPFYKRKIFWIFFVVFLFISGNLYLTLFSSVFQIKEIEISGNEELKEGVKNLVEAQIPKTVLSFQTKSIFLLNPKEISQLVLERFPQIEVTELLRKFPGKLELKLTERNPVAIFCSEKCFFIDKEGIIFKEFSGEMKFSIEELEKREIELGKNVIDKDLLSTMLKIKETLENNLKISLEKIIFVSENRINAKTLEGWEIYFNPQKDIDWQLMKLKTVLEEEIPVQKRKDLEYVELRFGNLAPYKYKESINIENKD